MTPGWTYQGDVNIREGGFYWRPLYDDCVECVEVSPTSDDTVFEIREDSIYIPEDKYETALQTCGYTWLPKSRQIIDCTGHAHTDILPLLVDAFYAYWGLNDPSFALKVQIGGPRTPDLYDYRIAHNASLRKFVERRFLS